jgi:threonine aldolase
LEDLQRIKQVCDANNLKFHLDGARIWNALVAKSKIEGIWKLFDTISVCLSKG